MREQLLRQALESRKTTSKKQRVKQTSLSAAGLASRSSSKANSAANSRAGSTATSPRSGSLVGSQAGTDDEHDSLFGSDPGSDDFGSELAAQLREVDSWEAALEGRIHNILNRNKRRDVERLEDLRWYLGIIQNHYASTEIQPLLPELVGQLLKSSTAEDEQEAALALKALGATMVTDQSEDYFDSCAAPLKSLIQDYGDEHVKADALRLLATATFVSGGPSDALSVMAFLLEIVESDGSRILAEDSSTVVAAAITAFSICCSRLPDLDPEAGYLQDVDREVSQEAIEAIAEQLESSSASVQIAAAEAIAMLLEKSWRRATPLDADDLEEDDVTGKLPGVIQKYKPYRNEDGLHEQLQNLHKKGRRTAGIKKSERAALHDTLTDVMQSMEHPGAGPGFRGKGWKPTGRHDNGASSDKDTDDGFNTELAPRIRYGPILITSWWQLVRVREFRAVLGNGFLEHCADNDFVREYLDKEYDGIEDTDDESGDENQSDEDPKQAVDTQGSTKGKKSRADKKRAKSEKKGRES